MKRISLFFVFVLSIITAFAGKTFEGVITYEAQVEFPEGTPESKAHFMKDMMLKMGGSEKTIYYAEGRYKFLTVKGEETEEILLNVAEKQLLLLDKKYGSEDMVYKAKGTNWRAGGVVKKMEHGKETVKVLDHDCKTVSIEDANSTLVVYYDEKMPLTPTDFDSHNMEHFKVIANETKSIPLRWDAVMPDGTKISFVATKIEERKLKEEELAPKEGVEIQDISKM